MFREPCTFIDFSDFGTKLSEQTSLPVMQKLLSLIPDWGSKMWSS